MQTNLRTVLASIALTVLSFLGTAVFLPAVGQGLAFNRQGQFTVVQFTDIHYRAGVNHSASSITMMEATLDEVKPDLVVFTGDIVVSKPSKKGWDEVLDVVISRGIPYLVTLGNHDDESELTREEVASYVASKDLVLNKDVQLEGVSGYLNTSLTVSGRNGKPAAILYAMDSQAYSRDERLKGYGWFDHNQVSWYRERSAQHKEAVGDTLPALAFFHIPLPEYTEAFDNLKNKRRGVRYEAECPPFLNTGMYAAMFESGDVLGTFVGHDHVNDYLVDFHGIALAYGCFSGSANTYQRSKNGARIIRLTEGQHGFETWIREFDGVMVNRLSYPF